MTRYRFEKRSALPEHLAPREAKLMEIQGEIGFNTTVQSYEPEHSDSFDIAELEKQAQVGVFTTIFLVLLRDKRPV